jgi:hypothetical protein
MKYYYYIIYIGRIIPAPRCADDIGFEIQGAVFGWDGVRVGPTNDDFGFGRPKNKLVVLPLNALIFSVSLEQGAAEASDAKVEWFKDML